MRRRRRSARRRRRRGTDGPEPATIDAGAALRAQRAQSDVLRPCQRAKARGPLLATIASGARENSISGFGVGLFRGFRVRRFRSEGEPRPLRHGSQAHQLAFEVPPRSGTGSGGVPAPQRFAPQDQERTRESHAEARPTYLVIPAQAGTQLSPCKRDGRSWAPAFAGVTMIGGARLCLLGFARGGAT